jgi:hypothetical protein
MSMVNLPYDNSVFSNWGKDKIKALFLWKSCRPSSIIGFNYNVSGTLIHERFMLLHDGFITVYAPL